MALFELTAHSQTLEREVDFLVILPEGASGHLLNIISFSP